MGAARLPQAHLAVVAALSEARASLRVVLAAPWSADVVLLVDDEDQVATALELIEAASPADLWLKIQPLLAPDSDLSLEDRVRVGKRLYENMTESVDDALEEYLMSSSEIWPAFVLDMCIKNELFDFLDSVVINIAPFELRIRPSGAETEPDHMPGVPALPGPPRGNN